MTHATVAKFTLSVTERDEYPSAAINVYESR
jgi:hypothetical protein